MLKRILTAVVGLPLLLAVVWLGGYWFTALAGTVATIAAWELGRMAKAWGQPPFLAAALPLTVLLAVSGRLVADLEVGVMYAVTVAALAVIAGAALVLGRQVRGTAGRVLSTICTILFLGGTLFHAQFVRAHDDGRMWILFLLAVTFAADTGAYAVGRTIGNRKLAPTISPRKTWEGAGGGLICAAVAGLMFGLATGTGPSVEWFAVTAVILGITGQVGDLYMSALKRRAGIDNSGAIFPGHGGLLDRTDSILFNIVALVYSQVPVFLVLFDP